MNLYLLENEVYVVASNISNAIEVWHRTYGAEGEPEQISWIAADIAVEGR